jgi:hypothetical protein
VSGYGAMVCSGTAEMVRGTKVPSDGGVVVMGTVGVTMFHPQEMGKPELPPPLEAVLPSLVDSSRMICSDGDLMRTIPMNMTPESFRSRERLRLPKRSAMNSKLLKRM